MVKRAFKNLDERDYSTASERYRGLADQIVFEDRRSGGVNFGTLDGPTLRKMLLLGDDVDGTRTRYVFEEVVAVRGDRSVLARIDSHYGDGSAIGTLTCFRVTSDFAEVERIVWFDNDDVDAAVVLLAEWHAEIGD